MRLQHSASDDAAFRPVTEAPKGLSVPYIATWGLLAALALGYMTILLMHPELTRPVTTQSIRTEPPPARSTLQLMSEVESLRRTVADLQRELSHVKTTANFQSDAAAAIHRATTTEPPAGPDTQAVQTVAPQMVAVLPPPERLERGLPEPPLVTSPEPARSKAKAASPASATEVPKSADRTKLPNLAASPDAPKPAPSKKTPDAARNSASNVAQPTKTQLETASLPPIPQPKIEFGPATVTHAPEAVGIYLDGGPSLESLRLRWSVLSERHQSVLKDLEPRYVTSGSGDSPFFILVAGPIATPDEARRVCALLKAKKVACSVGPAFAGTTL